MAEMVCAREGSTRRASFRKSLRDGSLPAEYLEALEQKRKQLDESIHKYIASKEREFKQYEHDLRHQNKGNGASSSAPHDAQHANGVGKRRTSSGSAHEPGEIPKGSPSQGRASPADALLSAGGRRESDSSQVIVADEDLTRPPSAGLVDREASIERDKEFVGVFTPPFLPALDNKELRAGSSERASSAPAAVDPSTGGPDAAADIPRAHSDSAVQAKAKRPALLQQLAHRTSSSGSSADGKLASAMKSPMQIQNTRPKRKRVSLAVGDSIVAPSDSVPVELSSNTTPSHSRTRFPAAERELTMVSEEASTPPHSKPPDAVSVHRVEQIMSGRADTLSQKSTTGELADATPPGGPANPNSFLHAPNHQVDPDGDLFDLEDSDSGPVNEEIDEHDDVGEGISGRVERAQIDEQPEMLDEREEAEYDPEAGVVAEEVPREDHAVHLEFHPGSASQLPSQPGFRRPSVIRDPVFVGTNYQAAEQNAVEDDVYGSSFSRPGKGSFGGGSLGESYMARHSQEMERLRLASEAGQVPS